MFGLGPGVGGLPRGGMRDYGRGGGHGRRQPYAVLLAMKLLYQISQLRHKPPLTLALMAGMTVLHVNPNLLGLLLVGGGAGEGGRWAFVDRVRSVCLHPASMLQSYERTGDPEIRRLFMSPFVHGDDMHLYYNMASFLLKGVALELTMGTQTYAGLLAFTLLASQLMMVAVAWVLLVAFDVTSPMQTCTVGFSGVLFALTYVVSRWSPGVSRVMGISVNIRYAVWLELVLISVMVPNASFLGHLCGILAGMLYVEVPAVLRLLNLLTGATLFNGSQRPSYTYSSGTASAPPRTSGRGESPQPSAADTAAAEEAAIQEALRRSLLDSAGGGGGERSGGGGGGSSSGGSRSNGSGRDGEGEPPGSGGGSGMSARWNAEPVGDAAAAAAILGPAPPLPTAPPLEADGEEVFSGEELGGAGNTMGRDELRRRRLQRLGEGIDI